MSSEASSPDEGPARVDTGPEVGVGVRLALDAPSSVDCIGNVDVGACVWMRPCLQFVDDGRHPFDERLLHFPIGEGRGGHLALDHSQRLRLCRALCITIAI
jgi:hypothetical protein